ncbi:hypothetical protein ACFQZ4_06370 [Catellatospora coxensis]
MPTDLRRLPDRLGVPRTDFAVAAVLVLAGIVWAIASGDRGDAPAPVHLDFPDLGTRPLRPEAPTSRTSPPIWTCPESAGSRSHRRIRARRSTAATRSAACWPST